MPLVVRPLATFLDSDLLPTDVEHEVGPLMPSYGAPDLVEDDVDEDADEAIEAFLWSAWNTTKGTCCPDRVRIHEF